MELGLGVEIELPLKFRSIYLKSKIVICHKLPEENHSCGSNKLLRQHLKFTNYDELLYASHMCHKILAQKANFALEYILRCLQCTPLGNS
jgi:hypothetical protein